MKEIRHQSTLGVWPFLFKQSYVHFVICLRKWKCCVSITFVLFVNGLPRVLFWIFRIKFISIFPSRLFLKYFAVSHAKGIRTFLASETINCSFKEQFVRLRLGDVSCTVMTNILDFLFHFRCELLQRHFLGTFPFYHLEYINRHSPTMCDEIWLIITSQLSKSCRGRQF